MKQLAATKVRHFALADAGMNWLTVSRLQIHSFLRQRLVSELRLGNSMQIMARLFKRFFTKSTGTMMNSKLTPIRQAITGFAAILAFALVLPVNAQDLSDDIFNPDVFIIGASGTQVTISNSVFESDLSDGTTGNQFGDIDFFNIQVDSGFQLDSIFLDAFDGGGLAFTGFAENQLGGNPAIADQQPAFVETALGFTLIDGTETSLFDDLAAGESGNLPGIGFDPNDPLGAGTYAFVFQNTGGNINNYTLTFNGSAIPEPSSTFVVALFGLATLRRRR